MSKLDKEKSVVLNDNDDDNNDDDDSNDTKKKSDLTKKRIKTEVITNRYEFQTKTGEPAEFNLNLNGEVKKNDIREQKTAVCWNCQSLLIIKDGWDIVECSECHKLNRLPKDNNPINQRISVAKSYGNLNQDSPYIFGIAVCPICDTENRFQKNSTNVTCYKCGNNINVNNRFFNYNNSNNNFINRSYDFSSPLSYIPGSPFNPNVIQLRGLMPLPPMIGCHGNCTECTLLKILQALTKEPKNTYIPYPMYPFYGHEEPKREIRYVQVPETKKVEPDDEYKIVIRKKPKNRNGKSVGHYNKNKAFEKVFFSKLK